MLYNTGVLLIKFKRKKLILSPGIVFPFLKTINISDFSK